MKDIFSKITLLAALACCCLGTLPTAAQDAPPAASQPATAEPVQRETDRNPQETAPSQTQVEGQPQVQQQIQGQALMQAAAKLMSEQPTVEAKLRVRTNLLGQPLVGSGDYAQLRASNGLLLRMQLSIRAGDHTSSVQQVSDGRHLWEHFRIGDTERLRHVDLLRVERELAKYPAAAVAQTTGNLGSGGLPKLLLQLEQHFDFSRAPVLAARIGEVPVWVATGVWKRGRLAAIAPTAELEDGSIEFEKLPTHLPHQVEVQLGQADWFPYRVTYHRWNAVDGQHVLQPAVTTEFFEVAIAEALDQAQFVFERPKNVSVAEGTDSFLQSLGVAKQPSDDVRR